MNQLDLFEVQHEFRFKQGQSVEVEEPTTIVERLDFIREYIYRRNESRFRDSNVLQFKERAEFHKESCQRRKADNKKDGLPE